MKSVLWPITITLTAVALAASADEVAPLRAIYEQHLEAIQAEHKEQSGAWPAQYRQALLRLQARFQQGGSLDGWSTAKKELERFDAEGDIPRTPPAALPEPIRVLQSQFADLTRKSSIETSLRVIDLSEKYADRLVALKRELTRKGAMEDALTVDAEIKRVRSSAPVSSAEFEVAAYEAEQARLAAEEAAREAPPDEEPRPQGDPSGPAAGAPDLDSTSGGVTVFEPGETPPRERGLLFKRSSLHTTDHCPLVRPVSLSVATCTQRDVSSSTDAYYSSSTTSKSSSIIHRARVSVRASVRDTELQDLLLTVQFFAKDASRSAGKIEPMLVSVKRACIPTLSNQSVHIDFPPVSVSNSSYSYYSSYSSSSSSRSGREFYGLIVSVFGPDGQMLYQAATVSHLKATARAAVPRLSREDLRRRYEALRDEYNRARDAHYADTSDQSLNEAYRAASAAYEEARGAYYGYEGD